ncbi:hypothetical protein KY304_01350 [Candidatus Woesearchaeota archaeon]|nr:hypothetical protein [Candidatus Woesearchaeota archaeon]
MAGGVPFYLEILYILFALFVSLIILLGAAFDAKWAWPVATILFAVNLANAVCLYLIIGALLTFALMVLINSVGVLTSVLLISNEDDDDDFEPDAEPVETYDAEPEPKKKTKKRKK